MKRQRRTSDRTGSRDPQAGTLSYDPEAFEAFYRAHVEDVERFVARRVDDPQLAADLTADVFLAAIKPLSGYESSRGKPIAWLYGVARNVVADARRRNARELRANRRVSGRRLLQDDDIARLEDRIEAESAARSLQRAMGRLTARERAVLELVAIDGLTLRAAANALGISAVAARVRYHRARRQMREEIAPRVGLTPEDKIATQEVAR